MSVLVAGGDMTDLSSLASEIPFQFTGHVENPKSALVVPQEQRIAGDPDVVGPPIPRLEPSDALGLRSRTQEPA